MKKIIVAGFIGMLILLVAIGLSEQQAEAPRSGLDAVEWSFDEWRSDAESRFEDWRSDFEGRVEDLRSDVESRAEGV